MNSKAWGFTRIDKRCILLQKRLWEGVRVKTLLQEIMLPTKGWKIYKWLLKKKIEVPISTYITLEKVKVKILKKVHRKKNICFRGIRPRNPLFPWNMKGQSKMLKNLKSNYNLLLAGRPISKDMMTQIGKLLTIKSKKRK